MIHEVKILFENSKSNILLYNLEIDIILVISRGD